MVDMTTLAVEEPVYDMKPLVAPPEQEADIAALYHVLENSQTKGDLRLVTPDEVDVAIPESLRQILARVVQVMASGDGVSVVPVSQRLTVQQAADILNVPRPYMLGLLQQGEIPFVATGTEKLIHIKDVLIYKEKRDRQRRVALDNLAELSQMYGEYEG